MGATVTCQKAVAAFKLPGGIPIYVLFESTYEKNVTPHTPSWGCCWVGRIEGALKRIFGYAADCEGGLLQTRRGATTPEGYITDWLRCLAAPATMPDQAVRILCGASYLDTISPDRIAGAAALLTSHGLAEESRTLQEGGNAELRLHRDAEAIAALCGAGLASSFRLLDMVRPPDGPACDPRLGYAPARAGRVETTVPTLLKLGDNDLLVQAADGTWDVAGWVYDLVGRHVREAWQRELAAPGEYRTSIAALRHAARSAPSVPTGTQVLIHGLEEMSKRTRWAWTRIAERHEPTATPAGWQIPVTPALASSLICNLEQKHLSWLVPSQDAPPRASLSPEDRPPGTAAPA